MGASKSKVRNLNPKTIHELQKNIDVDFTKDEIEGWFREYQMSLDKGQNKLTEKEFRHIYNSIFDGDATEFVKHLFRSFDSNNDGYVDFKEFIVGLCVSGSERIDTKLKWAFRMYDVDGNGFITREEMTGMLKAIYRMVATDPTAAEDDMKTMGEIIADFFDSADQNKDNAISKDEFIDGVKAMPVILNLLQCDPDQDDKQVNNFDSLDDSLAKVKLQPEPEIPSTSGNDRGTSYKAT